MTLLLECEKCGNGLLPGDLKCKICGHFSGRECQSCTRHVPSGKRICDVCGHDLGNEYPLSNQIGVNTVMMPLPLDVDELADDDTSDTTTVSLGLDSIHAEPPVDEPTLVEKPKEQLPTRSEGNPLKSQVKPVAGTDWEPTRLDHTDYQLVLKTCEDLLKSRSDLYGVIGRPESGKTCFIYALGKLLKGWHGGATEVGNYSLDRNWENLIHYQEQMFDSGVEKPTARGLHFYKANAIGTGRKQRHFVMVDIRGEQFEQIDDWTHEITDFFLTYLTHCKGLYLFLELDPDAVSKTAAEVLERHARKKGATLSQDEQEIYRQVWRFKREQMNHMVSFLSVAATVSKVTNIADYEEQRSMLSHAHREKVFGSKTVEVPVVLCISKADLIKDLHFPGYPPIVPGSDNFFGDPWNVVDNFFPKELDNMKKLVPRLKLEWVSSTGENFHPQRGVGQPLGMISAYKHVIQAPPPEWALSTATYQRLAKFFRLNKRD